MAQDNGLQRAAQWISLDLDGELGRLDRLPWYAISAV